MRKRELLVATLLFLVVAAFQSRPLAARLGRAVPFDADRSVPELSGSWTWLWNADHVREALARGGSPWRADRVEWPAGADLRNHPLTLGWAVATLPLQAVGGPVLAVGVLCLLLPVAAALAAWLLAREAGAAPASAGLGAALWAFSPFFARASLDDLTLAATPWPPLFVLFLLRCLDPDRRPVARRRAAVGAGLVLGLAWLTSWTATVWVLTAGALAFVFAPGPGRRSRALVVPSGALFLVVLTAAAVGAARPWPDWAAGAAWVDPAGDGLARPALAGFLRLPSRHPLSPGVGASPDVALGVALATLVVVALGLSRSARRWLAAGALGLLVVADPAGLVSRASRSWTPLTWVGHTGHLLPAATLLLAVAAALGLDALRARRHAGLVTGWLVLLFAFEAWTRPAGVLELRPPEVVHAIERGRGTGSVLVLPVRHGPAESHAWQLVHGRPTATGWVARTNPAAPARWQRTAGDLFALAFRHLLGAHPPQVDPAGLSLDLDVLDVDHVLVIEDRLEDFPVVAEILDSMDRWVRGPSDGGVAWWYRGTLELP